MGLLDPPPPPLRPFAKNILVTTQTPDDTNRALFRDAIQATPTFPAMVVPYETGFTTGPNSWTPPTVIYRARDHTFRSTVHAQDLRPHGGIDIFVSKQGNDANDGLSWSTSKLTLAGAIASTAYTTIPTPTSPANIYVRPGKYAGLGTVTLLRDTSFIGVDGQPEFSGGTYGDAVTWTVEPGLGAGVYSAPYTAVNGFNIVIFDEKDIDVNGLPTAIAESPNFASVGGGPRRYYVDSNKLYVRLYDNRQPDFNFVWASSLIEANAITSASDGKAFYAENIAFKYGLHGFHATGASGNVTLYRCQGFGGYIKGFENEKAYPTLTWLQECVSRRNLQDGFSYRSSARAVEIDCIAILNGWFGTLFQTSSNNGSTCHDSSRVLRVNGIYAYNQDRNIHDVTQSRSFNIGVMSCYTQTSMAFPGTTTPYAGSNFVISLAGDTSVLAKMWLYECFGSEGSVGNYGAYHSAIMYLHNTSPGVEDTDGTGTFVNF